MRETIGTTWIFQLVIAFILIFASYLAIMTNYAKAFKSKNEVVSIIEKYEGLTSGGLKGIGIVNNYLSASGYHSKGACTAGYYGAVRLDDFTPSAFEYVDNNNNKKYYYCVQKVTFTGTKVKSYYNVVLFFNLDLPVLGQLFTFRATGSTTELDATYDQDLFGV